jgi:hypothetical protein
LQSSRISVILSIITNKNFQHFGAFIMVFTSTDVAATVKTLAKDNGTTVPSLVTEIVAWAFENGLDVGALAFSQAQRRGRKPDINKVELEKFSQADLEKLQSRIAAMTAKG